MHILIRMALWWRHPQTRCRGVPCIDGISCDKVVLYEKLPIKQTMLKDILELTQGLKRQDLVPDSVDYGAQNAPVVKYGNVSVIIGDTTKLTRKIERLKLSCHRLRDSPVHYI